MKRFTVVFAVLAVILFLGGADVALAQHGHAGGPPTGPSSHGAMSPDRPDNSGSSMRPEGKGSANNPNGSGSGKSVSDLLSQNTKLSSKVSKLTGMDAQQACSGFKNLGQCVAAAHVSQNLGIPFSELKSKMTGTGSVSLGKAISELKPSADSKAESKRAEAEAKEDIRSKDTSEKDSKRPSDDTKKPSS